MSKQNKAFITRQNRTRTKLKRHNRGLPRLSVFKSNHYIYAQVIDDAKGVTLIAANSLQKDLKGLKKKYNIEAAKAVGQKLAKEMLQKGLKKVVFDKGGYRYYGKIKVLVESVKEVGVCI